LYTRNGVARALVRNRAQRAAAYVSAQRACLGDDLDQCEAHVREYYGMSMRQMDIMLLPENGICDLNEHGTVTQTVDNVSRAGMFVQEFNVFKRAFSIYIESESRGAAGAWPGASDQAEFLKFTQEFAGSMFSVAGEPIKLAKLSSLPTRTATPVKRTLNNLFDGVKRQIDSTALEMQELEEQYDTAAKALCEQQAMEHVHRMASSGQARRALQAKQTEIALKVLRSGR